MCFLFSVEDLVDVVAPLGGRDPADVRLDRARDGAAAAAAAAVAAAVAGVAEAHQRGADVVEDGLRPGRDAQFVPFVLVIRESGMEDGPRSPGDARFP